jgi:histidine phosphotransferase ChpT
LKEIIMDINLHPRVLELMASRICHDLVSPVGAISNGVELISELGEDAGDEAMKLIAASARQASVRLKNFRLCYGAAGTDKNLGFKDVRDAFVDQIATARVTAEFEPDLGVKFSMPPKGLFKVLLNVLILAEESCHGEGKISVTAVDGNKGIKVTVTGNNAALRDGAEAALKGETKPDDLDARSIHAYLTGKTAAFFGVNIATQAQKEHGRLELTLTV